MEMIDGYVPHKTGWPNMLYDQVYADFLQQCRPARPPHPWGRFMKNADLWAPPQKIGPLVAALREKHSGKTLLRSGVVAGDGHGKPTIGPLFFQLFTCILPLRALPEANPFDLLTGEGAISGRLPLYAAVQDHLVEKGITKRGFYCVAFSLRDVVSLRAVGIPAVPANGLERMHRKAFQEFCGTLGLTGPSHPPQAATPHPPHQAAASPPRVILVGWRPSGLSRAWPENLGQVLHNVLTIGKCLDVDLSTVLVWRPTAEEVRQIAICLWNGRRKDVVKAILRSINQSGKPLAAAASEAGSIDDFLEARAALRESLLRPASNPDYRRRRLHDYQQAVDRCFVQPILARAAQQHDPDDRSRLAGLAAANRLLHPSIELYCAKLEKEIAKTGLRGDGALPQTRELTRILDVVYRLTKDSD
jgi:hypothetical protein